MVADGLTRAPRSGYREGRWPLGGNGAADPAVRSQELLKDGRRRGLCPLLLSLAHGQRISRGVVACTIGVAVETNQPRL
jgi:hypothetical protein